MALIVEDGSGTNPAANSYISVAFADTYHAEANPTWATYTTAQKEAALVRGTRALDRRYTWKGYRVDEINQPLEWPRYEVYDDRNQLPLPVRFIPREIKQATAEFALREAAAPGSTNPDVNAGQTLRSETYEAGPVSTSKDYDAQPYETLQVRAATALVRYLTISAGGIPIRLC